MPSALSERVDVAIIGAGPAGLAAAHALAKVLPTGAKVAVFEKGPAASSNTPRGAGLGLDVNGLKALRAISPAVYEGVVNNHATTVQVSETRDPKGTVIKTMEVGPMLETTKAKYGEHSVQLGWHELVITLAQLLPPEVEVYNSTKFLSYEETEAGVKLRLASGDARIVSGPGDGDQEVTLEAGMLVAADGYFSGVREQCIHDGPPDFGGTMVWRARLQAEHAARFGFKERTTIWYFGDNRVVLVYTAGHGHVVWTASCPEASLDECGINWRAVAEARRNASAQSTDYLQRTKANGLAARERLLRAFENFDPALRDMFKATDPVSIVEHALYVRPAADLRPDCFGKGRVVIIGDAAHPLRPTGQGTNQALEDALSLARYVQRDRGGFGLLNEFRSHRAARVQPIMMHVEVQGKSAYKKTTAEAATSIARQQEEKEAQAAAVLRRAEVRETAAEVQAAAAAGKGESSDDEAGETKERRHRVSRAMRKCCGDDKPAFGSMRSTDEQGSVDAVAGSTGHDSKGDAPTTADASQTSGSSSSSGGATSPAPPMAAASAPAQLAAVDKPAEPAFPQAAHVVKPAASAPVAPADPAPKEPGLLEDYEGYIYLGEDFSPLVPAAEANATAVADKVAVGAA